MIVCLHRHVNFLGGSPLNRLSWLRTSTPFLTAVLASPHTRWILFRAGEPLVKVDAATKSHTLTRLPTPEVYPLLGKEPIFGQGNTLGEAAKTVDDEGKAITHVEAARIHGPPIVFLGLHEPDSIAGQAALALPSSDFSAKADPQTVAANIVGTPYFGLDVSEADASIVDAVAKNAESEFMEPRAASQGLSAFDAAVFAEARSMIDWNARNSVSIDNSQHLSPPSDR